MSNQLYDPTTFEGREQFLVKLAAQEQGALKIKQLVERAIFYLDPELNGNLIEQITDIALGHERGKFGDAKRARRQPMIGLSIFIVRDGKLLLGKRLKEYGYGHWQIAGGHLEFGESIEDGLARELFEETGLTPVEPFERLTYTEERDEARGIHYVSLFYLCRNPEGKVINPEPDKCEGWQWFDFENLPSPLFELGPVLQMHGWKIEGKHPMCEECDAPALIDSDPPLCANHE